MELASNLGSTDPGGLRMHRDPAGSGHAVRALEEVIGVGGCGEALSRRKPGAAMECELRVDDGEQRQPDVYQAGAVEELIADRRNRSDGECANSGDCEEAAADEYLQHPGRAL